MGDCKWILHEVSRRNKIKGRYIVSDLINSNPNLSEGNKSGKCIPNSYLRNCWSRSKVWLARVCGVKEKALRRKNKVQRLYFEK